MQGELFDSDNARLFSIMASAMEGGVAESLLTDGIRATSDARSLWESFLARYMLPTVLSDHIKMAHSVITSHNTFTSQNKEYLAKFILHRDRCYNFLLRNMPTKGILTYIVTQTISEGRAGGSGGGGGGRGGSRNASRHTYTDAAQTISEGAGGERSWRSDGIGGGGGGGGGSRTALKTHRRDIVLI